MTNAETTPHLFRTSLVFAALTVVTEAAFLETAGLRGVRDAVVNGMGVFIGRQPDGSILFRGTGALAKKFSEAGYDVHIEVVPSMQNDSLTKRMAQRARSAYQVNCFRIVRNREIEIR